MRQEKRLRLKMTIFYLIIFVSFGVIVLNEKLAPLNINKIDKKFNTYINDNYSEIKDELKKTKTDYKKTKYQLKIINKKNKNYYFYLYYSNKKITSTYKKDYIEGQSILKYLNKKLTKEINTLTNDNYIVTINNKLNDYNTYTKEQIINENNIINLKIYTLSKSIIINNFNDTEIIKELNNMININDKNNINPESYNITLTSKNDNKKEIIIYNITDEIIKSNDINNIINDIINNKKSDIIKKNNITFKIKQ